jgi:hypothetical protein
LQYYKDTSKYGKYEDKYGKYEPKYEDKYSKYESKYDTPKYDDKYNKYESKYDTPKYEDKYSKYEAPKYEDKYSKYEAPKYEDKYSKYEAPKYEDKYSKYGKAEDKYSSKYEDKYAKDSYKAPEVSKSQSRRNDGGQVFAGLQKERSMPLWAKLWLPFAAPSSTATLSRPQIKWCYQPRAVSTQNSTATPSQHPTFADNACDVVCPCSTTRVTRPSTAMTSTTRRTR